MPACKSETKKCKIRNYWKTNTLLHRPDSQTIIQYESFTVPYMSLSSLLLCLLQTSSKRSRSSPGDACESFPDKFLVDANDIRKSRLTRPCANIPKQSIGSEKVNEKGVSVLSNYFCDKSLLLQSRKSVRLIANYNHTCTEKKETGRNRETHLRKSQDKHAIAKQTWQYTITKCKHKYTIYG